MENLYQWWDKQSGMGQVAMLVCFLYAVSTPVVLLAGFLAM